MWLQSFTAKLTSDLGFDTPDMVIPPESRSEFTQLLARCYLKQGEWEVAVKDDWIPVGLLRFVVVVVS